MSKFWGCVLPIVLVFVATACAPATSAPADVSRGMLLTATLIATPQAQRPATATEPPDHRPVDVPDPHDQAIEEALKDVVITGQSDGAPPNCSPRDVARFIVRFIEAFNRGDQDRLARLFFRGAATGQSPSHWYSMTEGDPRAGGRHFVAYDLDVLLKYFAERRQQHEVMQLLKLQVNGWESTRGIVHFGPVVVSRRADDLGDREFTAEGKGAFHCREQAIIVWSLATPLADASAGTLLAATPIATPYAEMPATATPIPPGEHTIYVIDSHGGELVSQILVVNPDTRQPFAFYRTRSLPELAFSPDGRRMYVADSYLSRVTHGEPHDVLMVYDTTTGKLVQDEVEIPKRLLYKGFPQGHSDLFLSRDGRRLFVAKYGDPDIHALRLAVLDTETFKTLAEYRQPECHDLWPLSDGRLLCVGPSALSFVAPLTGETTDAMTLPPTQLAVTTLSSSGEWLYLASSDAHVTVINLAAPPLQVIADRIALNTPPGWQVGFNTMALSPDGARLYLGLLNEKLHNQPTADQVWAFDTHTWQRVGVFELADPAFHLAVSADGCQLYTVNPFKKTLAILDTTTFRQTGVVRDVGETPALIVVPPDTSDPRLASSSRCH